MLEIFAYKKYKKNKLEKEEKLRQEKGKGKEVPDVLTPPETPATSPTVAPVLDDDDERFLKQLTGSATPPPNDPMDDEGARPPLPPRAKTPDLTWDSDAESFRRVDPPAVVASASASDKGKEADKDKGKKPSNRLSALFQRTKSLRRSSSSSHSPPTEKEKGKESTKQQDNLAVPTVSQNEADRERDDLTRVLDDLNLAATENGKAFSLSAESTELVRRFTLVLKDLVNGVPTAVNDLTSLLDDRDGSLSKNYEKLPKSLKKLVTQLPDKLSSNLAPELLAVAAEAQGLGNNGGGVDRAAAREAGLKGAAKKLLAPRNLKDMVTKPGAVVSMLKGIMNALKTRWPAFIGTNVLWSLALFLLLFVLWYCHKRGREVRLEREASEGVDGGVVIDDKDRVEELPDDPALPAPGSASNAPSRSGSGRSHRSGPPTNGESSKTPPPPLVVEPKVR